MHIKFIPIAILLLILPGIMAAQDRGDSIRIYRKNQIGLQLNPFLDDTWFQTGLLRYMPIVAALRYGNRITKNLTSGVEFSCASPFRHDAPSFNYFGYKIGIFTRYTYPAYSRFQIFAEASPYYSHSWREVIPIGMSTQLRADKFGYYVAPGLSLYTKNRSVSFDFYYKFSNLMFQNGNKAVFSYKVNLNF